MNKDYVKTLCRALNILTNEHSELYRKMCMLEIDGLEKTDEYIVLSKVSIELATKIKVIRDELGYIKEV